MAAERSGGRSSNYHSPLRARQAAQTRRSIIEAAGALFAERGWSTATLPVIAERAGVSVDTIYATFGTKVALLMAVVDVAIMGDDDEAAMVDRPDYSVVSRTLGMPVGSIGPTRGRCLAKLRLALTSDPTWSMS